MIPSNESMASMVLIAYHATELVPPYDEGGKEVWTASTEFKKDHERAKKSCLRIIRKKKSDGDQEFIESLGKIYRMLREDNDYLSKTLAIQRVVDNNVVRKCYEKAERRFERKYGRRMTEDEKEEVLSTWVPDMAEIGKQEEMLSGSNRIPFSRFTADKDLTKLLS